MNAADSLDFLRKDLAERIAWQTKRLRIERSKAVILKTMAVTLAAAITVLLGLEGGVVDETVAKNLALFFGAVIVVVNAWEAFFSHRSLWIMHTINRARMDALETDIDFYLAGRNPEEIDPGEAEGFAARFRSIGETGLAQWLRLHDEGGGVTTEAEQSGEG